jgi:hypothetical protein
MKENKVFNNVVAFGGLLLTIAGILYLIFLVSQAAKYPLIFVVDGIVKFSAILICMAYMLNKKRLCKAEKTLWVTSMICNAIGVIPWYALGITVERHAVLNAVCFVPNIFLIAYMTAKFHESKTNRGKVLQNIEQKQA